MARQPSDRLKAEPPLAALSERIQNALDEGRILVLGTQIFLGLEYRSFFESGFPSLPSWARAGKLLGLCIMLVAFALMALPSAYHRLVEGGEDTDRVHRVASVAIGAALLPLAVAFGMEVSIAVGRVRPIGARGALAAGVALTIIALGLWYAGPALARRRSAPLSRAPQEVNVRAASLDQKIRHVLTETRMVLPGAQALLGFQLTVVLMDPFQQLPASAQMLHLGAIVLTALAVMLLVTPAAYHRIAEGGENTDRFHELASLLVLAAMTALAFALSADLALVAYKVCASAVVAASMGAGTLAVLLATWFGIPFRARGVRRRRHRVPAHA